MMEAIVSSETSVLTRAIRRKIPADGILQRHRREDLKSYRNFFLFISRKVIGKETSGKTKT
jgi:hypothetical protein